jgi:hypothetical protein
MIPWRVPTRYHQKFQKRKKKKEGVCFEKQNVHMNGGYVFQMNTLHITIYMKTITPICGTRSPSCKIPSTLNKEAYFSRRNIDGYKVPSKFTDLFE